MKIGQIVEALPSLQKLAAQDLSIKMLYKIDKLLGKLNDELVFYNDQRTKIFNKYYDIVGNQYQPREENIEQLNAEMGELLDTEVECDIKEVVINVNEDVKLSYNDLVQLKGFIRIEGED